MKTCKKTLEELSRDLQENKARLGEAQRVAHVGHYYWNLIENRVIWSDELYRIYGLGPQKGPINMATCREMIHPEDREFVFRTAEEALHSEARPDWLISISNRSTDEIEAVTLSRLFVTYAP